MDIKTIERMIESGVPLYAAWLEGFAAGIRREARREALEEAAKCVENKYVHEKIPMHVGEKIVTRECAAAIRALATQQPQPAPDAAPNSPGSPRSSQ